MCVCVAAFAVCLTSGQTLVLREAMAALYGSEFSFSMVLGGWLIGVSLGALAGGALTKLARPRLWWLCALAAYYERYPGLPVRFCPGWTAGGPDASDPPAGRGEE